MRNSTFECVATGSLPGDFIPREISNEAKKGEQQRHNSPQLTLSFFFFFAPRAFLESCSRSHVARLLQQHVLPLLTSEVKSEKRDIRSLSRKRRARSRCLSFFLLFFLFFFSFAPPRTSPANPRGCANVTIVQFCRFKYSAKGLEDSTRVLPRDFQARINLPDSTSPFPFSSEEEKRKLKAINTFRTREYTAFGEDAGRAS